MSLRYEYGELKLAETRGDGIQYGEDVTANAKVIRDVKKKLKDKPEYLEIRGEVYMTKADFDEGQRKTGTARQKDCLQIQETVQQAHCVS